MTANAEDPRAEWFNSQRVISASASENCLAAHLALAGLTHVSVLFVGCICTFGIPGLMGSYVRTSVGISSDPEWSQL